MKRGTKVRIPYTRVKVMTGTIAGIMEDRGRKLYDHSSPEVPGDAWAHESLLEMQDEYNRGIDGAREDISPSG